MISVYLTLVFSVRDELTLEFAFVSNLHIAIKDAVSLCYEPSMYMYVHACFFVTRMLENVQ